MTTCRGCKYLEVLPNKAGKRIPRANKVYPCLVPVPIVTLPACVTDNYGFRWPPLRRLMTANEPHNCHFYTKDSKSA